MYSDRKLAVPGQQQGYEMNSLQGYQQQGYQQQFPVSSPYPSNGTISTPEIHHHGTECSHLEEGKKEGEHHDNDIDSDDNIPGGGPGGVPDKYFALDFEDCFTEHKKTKTIPALYQVVSLAYKYTKLVLYHICVILVGIPLAIVWAIINGPTTFILVWVWGPILRYFIVGMYAIAPVVTTPYRAFVAPLVDVSGRIFRQIRIQATINGNLGKKLAGQEHIA